MTRDEKLAVIGDALAVLRKISPPRSGKAQHRCAVCVDSGVHPCPIGTALSALYEAHSVVWRGPAAGGESDV
jgi:hypothetical protein